MNARIRMIAAAVALMPALLSAQAAPTGEMTYEISGRMPEALAAQAPMQNIPTMRIQVGSDGRRIGMVTTIAGGGSDEVSAALAGMAVRVILPARGDSMHFGIAVPATIQPMVAQLLAPGMAAPEGYRLSMKLPNVDSIIAANKDKIDMQPSSVGDSVLPVALGTKATVAGIECENWRLTAPSGPGGSNETIDLCLAPASPQFAISEWMMKRFNIDKAIVTSPMGKLFNGRKLFPVRVTTSTGSMKMELVSASATAPAASFFDIPVSYHVVNPGDLPIPGAGNE